MGAPRLTGRPDSDAVAEATKPASMMSIIANFLLSNFTNAKPGVERNSFFFSVNANRIWSRVRN